jgi:hypothetical protein
MVVRRSVQVIQAAPKPEMARALLNTGPVPRASYKGWHDEPSAASMGQFESPVDACLNTLGPKDVSQSEWAIQFITLGSGDQVIH